MKNVFVKLVTMDGDDRSSKHIESMFENARLANPDAIIVRHPDTFLSPSMQIEMVGDILEQANPTFVQGDDEREVLILTYSSIVFDAIRVLIHQNKLAHELVECLYVYYDASTKEVQEVYVDLDEYGRLDHRPDGFFDSHSRMLSILMSDKPSKDSVHETK